MFHAPPWTKLVNLRIEANLVSVDLRVKEIAAGFMCRSLRRGRLGELNAEVLQSLQQRQDGVGPAAAAASPFASRMAQCLHEMGITLAVARTQDLPHPQYIAPAPWEDLLHSTEFITIKPKNQLTPQDISTIRREIDKRMKRPSHANYYTDGSVEPSTGVAACAFVAIDATASFRLTDGASTLQAELAGIMKALQHSSDVAAFMG